MKKILFVLVLSFVSLMATAQTQTVKLNPLGVVFGLYNASYESALSDKGSYQVGANFYSYKLFEQKTTGFGVEGGYRHYFREVLKGPYVFPRVGFAQNSTKVNGESASFSQANIGATIGWQWLFGSGFVFDLGVGYGYNFVIVKADSITNDYNRGLPRFGFSLGYAF